MTDRIETQTTTRRIKTGSTARRVDPATVAERLGASDVSTGPSLRQSPVGLLALRQEMFARLQSSGGRPALSGATRRQKVPLPESDWRQLELLSVDLRRTELNASPGQVASMLLHNALLQVRVERVHRSAAEFVDADSNSDADCPPRVLQEVA